MPSSVRIRQRIKAYLFGALFYLGVTRLARWFNRKRVIILCYHGVTERPTRSPDDPFGLHVRHERFAAQLEYLRRHYRVIALRDYLDAIRHGQRTPRYSVILTFDDGYRNFFTAAAPRLAERSLPAALFPITDMVRQDDRVPETRAWTPSDDDTYLSWAEVRALAQNPRYEVGSHTCSHPELPLLSPVDVERELRDSSGAIALHLGGTDRLALAYPKGRYTHYIARQAQSIGYGCALTTDEGSNNLHADLFTLQRILIGDDDTVPAFAARVSGCVSWLKGLRRRPSPLTPSMTGQTAMAP